MARSSNSRKWREGIGEFVAQGSPKDVAAEPRSHTGQFLKTLLERRPGVRKRKAAE